ncbi:ATP-binding SpoIIE family protein phosphatase [Streptomyces sp. NEAU-W12]|uniref:ATP-binding SpoIIE family protein phosphatase n=1 Tax=Streptomyces sp. NEAU-W12 TaxID=2994668 RepID=UPI00224B538A|nr:ATP-binding SpoIIE family protein phosphatase [Streptomyces sp. NEAU-W12]MCX2925481.1 SpoIIE family protein phosphatase [Streptomyces sp. NEAU-W12]
MGAIPTQRETSPAASETFARACARADATLPGGSLAPGSARALVRAALAEWTERALPGVEHLTTRAVDDAMLIASELVTNAVVHAGTEVRLTCALEEDTGALVIEVADRHPSRTPRDGGPDAVPSGSPEGHEYGRGLRLVAALSEAWGITYRPGAHTKTVWARVPARGLAADDPDDVTGGVGGPAGGGAWGDDAGAYAGESEPDGAYAVPWPGGGREAWRAARPYRRDGAWLGRGALSFLAEASDLLAGQLDEDLVAALTGQLIVPRLADWCAVWLEDESSGHGGWGEGVPAGGSRLARVWHADESRVEELSRVLEQNPPPPSDPLSPGPLDYPWPEKAFRMPEADLDLPEADLDLPGAVLGLPGAVLGLPEAALGGSEAALGGPEGFRMPGSLGMPGAPEGGPAYDCAVSVSAPVPLPPPVSVPAPGAALAYRLVVGGRPLGTLVIGRAGIGRFPDEITGLVEDLGRRVALAIGAARQYARQATIAAVLQRGLLPGAVAEIPGVRSAFVHEPLDKGGPSGDFYDLFQAGEGRWCFAVGDVQGKGPEAAVVIGLARPWLRLLAREGYRVADVLDRLNRLLLDDATEAADAAARALVAAGARPSAPGDGPQTRFLSLLYGELTLRDEGDGGARVTLGSAGHPLPLLLAPDGTVRTVAQPQTLLGVVEDATYTSETFELRPGDTLLCVTDGVTERRSGSRQFDDGDGLATALAGCAGLDAGLTAERINRLVHEFGARPPADDLALLVLQAE